jgi:hypothetical protein
MTPTIRLATGLSLAALLCACSQPKPDAAASASPSGAPSVPALAAGTPPPAPATVPPPPAGTPEPAAGPPNAPVPRHGVVGAIPLTADQQAALAKAIANLPDAERPRLRYALALGDDNRRHLVIYDGGGLDAAGRPAGAHDYVVFKVLNATDGSHYDPQADELVPPVPPPSERSNPGQNG